MIKRILRVVKAIHKVEAALFHEAGHEVVL